MVSNVEGISSKVSSIERCGAATMGVSEEREEDVFPIRASGYSFCFWTLLTLSLL